MDAITGLLLDPFVIFLSAKLAAELFERPHQSPVIGELLVGIAIGPYALGLIGNPSPGLVGGFHDDTQAAREAITHVYHLRRTRRQSNRLAAVPGRQPDGHSFGRHTFGDRW